MDLGMPFLLETQTLEEACGLAASLGLSFVELNMSFPQCGLKSLDAQRLNALKSRYGLYFTLHMDESFNPFEFDDIVRRAWLDVLERSLRLALEIEAPIVNMHMHVGVYITLPRERVYLYSRYSDEYHRAAEALRGLCDTALEGGSTRMSVENTGGFAPHEQAAIDMLLESPLFGLTLDVGHSLCAGDADMPFYNARIERLSHMHLHGAEGKRCHLPLDEGAIDANAMLALAHKHGARVVLETKTVEALKASVPLAQTIAAKLGE